MLPKLAATTRRLRNLQARLDIITKMRAPKDCCLAWRPVTARSTAAPCSVQWHGAELENARHPACQPLAEWPFYFMY